MRCFNYKKKFQYGFLTTGELDWYFTTEYFETQIWEPRVAEERCGGQVGGGGEFEGAFEKVLKIFTDNF